MTLLTTVVFFIGFSFSWLNFFICSKPCSTSLYFNWAQWRTLKFFLAEEGIIFLMGLNGKFF